MSTTVGVGAIVAVAHASPTPTAAVPSTPAAIWRRAENVTAAWCFATLQSPPVDGRFHPQRPLSLLLDDRSQLNVNCISATCQGNNLRVQNFLWVPSCSMESAVIAPVHAPPSGRRQQAHEPMNSAVNSHFSYACSRMQPGNRLPDSEPTSLFRQQRTGHQVPGMSGFISAADLVQQ